MLLASSLLAGLGACGFGIEQASEPPSGWKQLNDVLNPSHPLRLSFALRQPAIHQLESKIASSKSHLSRAEVRALRAPDRQDVNDVLTWLHKSGIIDAESRDGWIHVQTTVGKAEPLLDMKLHRYTFEDELPVLRTRKYAVPDALSEAIKFVHPIANFMTPKHEVMQSNLRAESVVVRAQAPPCTSLTTPDCIRTNYNITYVPAANSTIRFGVAGFLEENANYMDAHQFLQNFAPSVASAGYNFTTELVNKGQNSQDLAKSGREAALDIQYAMALGFPSKIIYYATGGRGDKMDESGKPAVGDARDNEPYMELLQYLLNKQDGELPQVLSISYADDELSVPKLYAERVCEMFGLLTSRGTSVLVGSGDGGARGTSSSNCRTNDGTNREVTMATFPGTCPWVTAVGAVTNSAEPPSGAVFSTGGFSQFFPQPEWQKAAVDGYVKALEGHLEPYYNSSMRAIPDISAVGTQFLTTLASSPSIVHGTSASTPVVAALIVLVNDARVRQGKKVLGWLNKHLYSTAVRSVLQDITNGTSVSCVFEGGKTPGGWPAKQGWDAITGLGVPKEFDRFMQALLEV